MGFLGMWQNRRDGGWCFHLSWFGCLLLMIMLALAPRTSARVVRRSESSSPSEEYWEISISNNDYIPINNRINSSELFLSNMNFNYPNVPTDLSTNIALDSNHGYDDDRVNTSTYSYSHGRILFIPIGAIVFLISLCLRMCICSARKPAPTTITVVRRTVVIPVVGRPDAEEGTDQPPSYADVQKEDPPPPYSEVSSPAAPHTAPEAREQPTTSNAEGGADQTSTAATPSAPEGTFATNAFSGRPRFLQSQYSYKPLE
ncbi:uncharacterized protein LOC134783930 [Penaeus indicus]|uniref:uncharacterized protein LOC134783930 n=1 Tax=Penaeus indicus TaxID=29960 RepID=UPI00300D84E4